MHALALTGLLGSGKTSLLLGLVERLTARGERVAIVENERGSIPVDGPYLEMQGVSVRQISAGCVCCDLAAPLLWTVELLVQRYRPRWLFLEASGVADAVALRASLVDSVRPGIDWRFITLVDAPRFGRMWADPYGLGHLIDGQAAVADLLLLTKADAVDRTRLLAAAHTLGGVIRPGVRVLPFAATDPMHPEMVLRAIEEDVLCLPRATPSVVS